MAVREGWSKLVASKAVELKRHVHTVLTADAFFDGVTITYGLRKDLEPEMVMLDQMASSFAFPNSGGHASQSEQLQLGVVAWVKRPELTSEESEERAAVIVDAIGSALYAEDAPNFANLIWFRIESLSIETYPSGHGVATSAVATFAAEIRHG